MTINEAIETLRYEIDEECHCDYIADEIRFLISEVENTRLKLTESRLEINRLQAENERLKPFEDKIAEFNSHIRVEDMLVFTNSLEEWLEFCDNLKAEAYKEFAEIIFSLFPADKNFTTISRFTIRQKLKELVGEDNATQ